MKPFHSRFNSNGTGNFDALSHLHVSDDHAERIEKWLRDTDERPSWNDYMKFQKELLIEKPEGKLARRGIPNTRPGYEANEVVPLHGFDAYRDLPEGWGLHSMLDSGGNHKIVQSGAGAVTRIWNGWHSFKSMLKPE